METGGEDVTVNYSAWQTGWFPGGFWFGVIVVVVVVLWW